MGWPHLGQTTKRLLGWASTRLAQEQGGLPGLKGVSTQLCVEKCLRGSKGLQPLPTATSAISAFPHNLV